VAAERVERRLAAILAADVAGYSRLMGADEEGTLARLKTLRRDLIDPKIAEHHGRIVKTTGDGLLIEFSSVVDAVRCAAAVQQAMRGRNAEIPPDRRIEFRAGINIGDIIIDAGDIYGDGVNIAARLEALAEPGGLCISDDAHRQIEGKLDLAFTDLGEQALKNIARPVRVRRLVPDAPTAPRPALTLPDKPSLAVLPFQNMSGDPEQEYFADGMVEDITTALSRIGGLFVIARNSAFTYKGRAVDVRQVGRELGVRYVLEGSVRKSGNRVRITGQLVDAATGAHLWADRFDGPLDDVFDLQDRVTASVAGAIEPHLQRAEIKRAQHKPTQDLGAYDYFLRGMAIFHEWSTERMPEARVLFGKAWTLDPGYGAAYAAAARTFLFQRSVGKLARGGTEEGEAVRLARLAAETGQDDPMALWGAAIALGYLGGQPEAAALLSERACALNPNAAAAWSVGGYIKLWLGDPDGAVACFARAERLSPRDPLRHSFHEGTAHAHFFAGRYVDAVAWAEQVVSEQPRLAPPHRLLAAGLAMSGRLDAARAAMAEGVRLAPHVRLSNVADWISPYRRPEYVARITEAFRLAGLPE
jgi:adenylate cyclase